MRQCWDPSTLIEFDAITSVMRSDLTSRHRKIRDDFKRHADLAEQERFSRFCSEMLLNSYRKFFEKFKTVKSTDKSLVNKN